MFVAAVRRTAGIDTFVVGIVDTGCRLIGSVLNSRPPHLAGKHSLGCNMKISRDGLMGLGTV